jgi:hypothetical protein
MDGKEDLYEQNSLSLCPEFVPSLSKLQNHAGQGLQGFWDKGTMISVLKIFISFTPIEYEGKNEIET